MTGNGLPSNQVVRPNGDLGVRCGRMRTQQPLTAMGAMGGINNNTPAGRPTDRRLRSIPMPAGNYDIYVVSAGGGGRDG